MTRHRVHEILLGALGVLWGAWLVVFDSYYTSPVLAVLHDWLVPEILLILLPALAGIGLWVFPTTWKKHIHFFLCLFWCFITAAIAHSNIMLTAVPVYATVGLLHACSGLLPSRLR